MRSVHGDARDVNVLVRRTPSAQQSVLAAQGVDSSCGMDKDAEGSGVGQNVAAGSGQLFAGEGGWQACFVDFDWAGCEGASRYPLHMNHAMINWSAGVEDNSPMLQHHDEQLLASVSHLQHGVPYNWQAGV